MERPVKILTSAVEQVESVQMGFVKTRWGPISASATTAIDRTAFRPAAKTLMNASKTEEIADPCAQTPQEVTTVLAILASSCCLMESAAPTLMSARPVRTFVAAGSVATFRGITPALAQMGFYLTQTAKDA